MSEFFSTITNNKELLWSVKIFTIIAASLLIIFVIEFTVKYIKNRLKGDKNSIRYVLINAARKPLKALIWILGIAYAAKVTGNYSNVNLLNVASTLTNLGIIFSISWFIWRLIKEYERYLLDSKSVTIDATTVNAIAKLLKTAAAITAVLMILQTLGVSIGGVLAFGGVGGIVIGFAAKDLLSNFFGAIMIYLDRPFSVGDWIRSPDRQIEGTVEYIGWRLTYIRTFDKRMLYIPNSIFSTIAVENPSRMSHRRIYETIGVRYKDVSKVAVIIDEIKDMLTGHKEIDSSQTLMVNLNKFNEYSVDFFIYTFTHTTNWVKFHGIKQEILLKISDIITKNDGEIAFPTSVIDTTCDPISISSPV